MFFHYSLMACPNKLEEKMGPQFVNPAFDNEPILGSMLESCVIDKSDLEKLKVKVCDYLDQLYDGVLEDLSKQEKGK